MEQRTWQPLLSLRALSASTWMKPLFLSPFRDQLHCWRAAGLLLCCCAVVVVPLAHLFLSSAYCPISLHAFQTHLFLKRFFVLFTALPHGAAQILKQQRQLSCLHHRCTHHLLTCFHILAHRIHCYLHIVYYIIQFIPLNTFRHQFNQETMFTL